MYSGVSYTMGSQDVIFGISFACRACRFSVYISSLYTMHAATDYENEMVWGDVHSRDTGKMF